MKGFQDSKGNCLCVYTATKEHKTGEPGCYWEQVVAVDMSTATGDIAGTIVGIEYRKRDYTQAIPVSLPEEEFKEAREAMQANIQAGPAKILVGIMAEQAAVEKGYPSTWDEEDEPEMSSFPGATIDTFLESKGEQLIKVPNMKVSITPKQTRKRPQRTTVHGEPGIGKTTFAADAPDVVFLCTEAGADNVNVSHLHYDGHDPRTYEEVLAALEGVPTDGSVKNVCIDTVDGLEGIIHAHIKTTTGKPVGEHGYGKGYDKALDLMRGVLASLERLRDKGVGTILLAHSTIESFANPEGADFSYVTIKSHKKIAGLLVEWSDQVLYARREQRAYTNDAGKTIGVGSSKREMCTEKTPTFVAKNRLRLPPAMPLSWADYQRAIDTFVPLDAKALRKEASELAAAFGAPAMAELEKIGDDAGDLLAFVEYCKGLKK